MTGAVTYSGTTATFTPIVALAASTVYTATITTGATYDWNLYKLNADATYNTGLRTGFANLESLPSVFQVNVGVKRTFQIAGHPLSNQLTLLNIFDRVNLIRPSGGLGVFQSAYGPRFTLYDAVTLAF